MIGAPVFSREIVRHARRPRTYTFQALFLLALVLCVIPNWPGRGQSGAEIADGARRIFEWGGYLQLLLLALLAPAVTANSITEEKTAHTLDLLLLTGTGPFSIVLGKFVSRLYVLLFLLFLTVPILFALLTLGGVAASTLLMEVALLAGFSVFCTALGVFLSTILPRTTSVLVVGYVVLGLILAGPFLIDAVGLGPRGGFLGRPGPQALYAAKISPMYTMDFVFNPTHFSATAETHGWWIAPAWSAGAGLGLVLLSALLLPRAAGVSSALSVRRALDAFDRTTYLLLRPRLLLGRLRGEAAAPGSPGPVESRPVGVQNPIYWKETTVNTIGRFKHWWRINLLLLAGLVGTWIYFGQLNQLGNPEFHKVSVAILAGLIVILTTVIAATTVSREREDGTLILLATTPVDCATYVVGKMHGIARNNVFLVLLPFLHVLVFTVGGVISPWTMIFLLLSIPVAVAASIMQGIFVSLLFPTTLRAIVAAIVLIIGEALLPFVCCLPQFNLPIACYYMVAPASGMQAAGTGGGTSMIVALLLASSFGAGTQLGYTFVVYSLIRSGFDRYIGRAA